MNNKENSRVGYRELVKTKVLTRKQAIQCLLHEAENNGETAIVKASHAYRNLSGETKKN